MRPPSHHLAMWILKPRCFVNSRAHALHLCDRLSEATSASVVALTLVLGSRLQGDGDDEADVRYRMDIAQAAFASLSHLWTDHRLSRNLKLRLYHLCVCSTLTHSCEAWNLTKAVSRILNGFNSRCLHVITGDWRRVSCYRCFSRVQHAVVCTTTTSPLPGTPATSPT